MPSPPANTALGNDAVEAKTKALPISGAVLAELLACGFEGSLTVVTSAKDTLQGYTKLQVACVRRKPPAASMSFQRLAGVLHAAASTTRLLSQQPEPRRPLFWTLDEGARALLNGEGYVAG